MTGTTTSESLPYPALSDFADVQDAFRLATAIDSDLRGEQAPFRAFMGRPSFIGLQTANQAGANSTVQAIQMQTIEWDNTGGAIANNSFWSQPLAQPPSWWLFGATIRVSVTGTPAVGDLNMGQITASTADQVTGLITRKIFSQRNDETNTGGEWINLFAMVPVYRATVQSFLRVDGTTAKGIGAGSRFWGMYMGPVT